MGAALLNYCLLEMTVISLQEQFLNLFRTEQRNKLGTIISYLPRHFNHFDGVFTRRESKTDSVAARGHMRERLSPSRITPG
jgi:hypothetical protein